ESGGADGIAADGIAADGIAADGIAPDGIAEWAAPGARSPRRKSGATNTTPGAACASACNRAAGVAAPAALIRSSDCDPAPANRASQRSAHATCDSAAGALLVVAPSAL